MNLGLSLEASTQNLFHMPDCKWMKKVGPASMVEFGSHAEAVEAGRKPCKTCKS